MEHHKIQSKACIICLNNIAKPKPGWLCNCVLKNTIFQDFYPETLHRKMYN